ncbi:MAG: shikimate kinase [Pseudomonadota bacterium]
MLGKRNIYLIGPMGSGKTAVGRQLSKLLGLPFYDSDVEVERRTGVDIPFIFEREGEAGFRAREREAIEALVQMEPIVMATGGGAILNEENRRLLAEHGTVIYLETSLSQQLQRVGSGRGRPLLKDGDLAERLRKLREVRDPIYNSLADHIVLTDHRRVNKVAEDIVHIVRGPDAAESPGPV